MIEFANSYLLLLMIVPLGLIVWYILRGRHQNPTVQVSSTYFLSRLKGASIGWVRHMLFGLRILAIALVVVVLARPQSYNSWETSSINGIDIMIAMDISGSMLAADFKPNRIEAAKDVAAKFINGRSNDNIGLVIFSGESFTQCPLTTDHTVLLNLFDKVKSGMIDDGTAIGSGLATAVSRLKDSPSKSKVIILLTDGSNNMGDIAPVTAGEIAQSFGIRVYTIGVGSMGTAPYPVQTPFGIQYRDVPVEIDEAVLQKIASTTDGEYFRATDKKSLQKIYEEIDRMEKTKIDIKEYSKRYEEYRVFALAALGVLLVEFLLRYLLFKKIP